MANESHFCGTCGASMSGPFCGSCGAPAAQGVGNDAVQDAPTRMRAGVSEEQTSYRPQPAERITGAETGWYQSADASSGSRAPYAGAHDGVSYQSQAAYGQGATYSGARYQAAQQQQPAARRSSNTPFIAAGLVSVLVLACLGGYVLMRGGDDDTNAAPIPSQTSTSTTPTTSTAPSSTSSAAPSQTAIAQPTVTTTATATSTVTSRETTTASPSPTGTTVSGEGLGGLSNPRGSVVQIGDKHYVVTQDGLDAHIYEGSNSGAKEVADITLPDRPKYEQRDNSLTLVALPNCSMPVLAFNSYGVGSAAYGWTGSGYKAYKSPGGKELEPTVDPNDTKTLPTWGVYVIGNDVVYKDTENTPESKWKHFSSCSRQNPDYLKQD